MLGEFPTIQDVDVHHKRVLLRVDFNVPQDKSGNITDPTRIEKSLDTINYLTQADAAIIIISHLGRPKTRNDKEFSLAPVYTYLREHLPSTISFHEGEVDSVCQEKIKALKPREILLLENIRYYPEETSKEKADRKRLADLLTKNTDVYVNDAFGAAHREHASIVECAEALPKAAGLLLSSEVKMLQSLLKMPARPFVAVIGGAKVSSKIGILETLIPKVDSILIGGAMAYTFLKSRLVEIGDSLVEKDWLSRAFQIIDKANYHEKAFLLPEDHLCADSYSENAKTKNFSKQIPSGWMGMDIGSKTTDRFAKEIKNAKTVLWNGPMGVFEMKKFSEGTISIAKALAKSKATTIVGGGDSVAALKVAGVEDKIHHVSTGGGATLEFLEGKQLPGVKALMS